MKVTKVETPYGIGYKLGDTGLIVVERDDTPSIQPVKTIKVKREGISKGLTGKDKKMLDKIKMKRKKSSIIKGDRGEKKVTNLLDKKRGDNRKDRIYFISTSKAK
ncbi:hypothetical protein ADUPG1_009958 [Aduncisulcus paluster]|uniref:Uncharacterized protein n=1 Tax=Aduncisulcus paluster TaxID=2918883 RepID=A0ABQ5KZG9_9EUKA|nr:hypothetical protein ADUPG1_009958 [Aduncisulcus paluster]|eukprot:gnl/Carplike_NY0171/7650_a10560_230.p2 GENE.gnl/Carplike_NY0171/7650_a10560_230~~gnl/Carplike_NY0171/7650_a10560_230.p2  ORF type:complete len:114 (-),score=18.42 gnl/Carplike_NY0171/7650_a10560_230:374-688(-)